MLVGLCQLEQTETHVDRGTPVEKMPPSDCLWASIEHIDFFIEMTQHSPLCVVILDFKRKQAEQDNRKGSEQCLSVPWFPSTMSCVCKSNRSRPPKLLLMVVFNHSSGYITKTGTFTLDCKFLGRIFHCSFYIDLR